MDIEIGQEYRLLPGARHSRMSEQSYLVDGGATRVRVVRGLDGDGDAFVEALDGDEAGNCSWVMPRYLTPLDSDADTLNPRRLAALEKARELLGENADALGLIELALFIITGTIGETE